MIVNKIVGFAFANTNNLSTMNIPAGTSLRIPNNIEFAKGD